MTPSQRELYNSCVEDGLTHNESITIVLSWNGDDEL